MELKRTIILAKISVNAEIFHLSLMNLNVLPYLPIKRSITMPILLDSTADSSNVRKIAIYAG